MSEVIESADQLFDLLAGDDEEVPATLLRGKKSSRHEQTLIDQGRLDQLNKVEKWMNSADAVSSDPIEFVSLGETIFESLLKSKVTDLSLSIVQKLSKLAQVWLKASKSCKLIEPQLTGVFISNLIQKLIRAKSPTAPIQDICGRMLVAMVHCSPTRLQTHPDVIKAFNQFVISWSKGTYKGNGYAFLNSFPLDFLSRLTWKPSGKPFILGKIHDLVLRLLKKGMTPIVNQDEFIAMILTNQGQHKKELEEALIKFGGAVSRSRNLTLSTGFQDWLRGVAARDTKLAGVSTKNVRLAADLLKFIDSRK